jgi:high-affinity K+ transport system ATPase subunit B
MATAKTRSIWDPQIVRTAVRDSVRKLHPRTMMKNPVMFVVEVGSVLTTLRLAIDAAQGRPDLGFELQITFWLWLTIIPAMFVVAFPALVALNVMGLRTPQSAILSAVIFNALIIVVLVPLALRGVSDKAMSAESLLRRNLLIYGVGGLVAPFVGIKIIDVIITTLRLA